MTKRLAIVMLLIVAGNLAACAGSDRNGTGVEYVGRFDNDENRQPMLVGTVGPYPSPQVLVYGDGEH